MLIQAIYIAFFDIMTTSAQRAAAVKTASKYKCFGPHCSLSCVYILGQCTVYILNFEVLLSTSLRLITWRLSSTNLTIYYWANKLYFWQ